MRELAIWISGLLGSAAAGLLVGGRVSPYSGGEFWGIVTAVCWFICIRLWTTSPSVNS